MSIEAMTWAFTQRGLNPTERLILLYFANDASKQHDYEVWPGRKTISVDLELSKSTISRVTAGMEERGLLKRLPRTRQNGSQTSNRYRLVLAPPLITGDNPPLSSVRRDPLPPVITPDSRTKDSKESTDTPNGVSATRGHPAVAAFMDSAKQAGYGNAASLLRGRVAGMVERAEEAGVKRWVTVKAAAYCGANDRGMGRFANYCADIESGHSPGRNGNGAREPTPEAVAARSKRADERAHDPGWSAQNAEDIAQMFGPVKRQIGAK